MQPIWEQITQLVGAYIPQLAGALAILILGWLGAVVVAALVRRGLRPTILESRVVRWLTGGEPARAAEVKEWIAKAVFYFIMLFVLVAFFQVLGLTLITEPLNRLLTQVFEFAPRLLGAGLLLVIAWILASVLRLVVSRVLGATRLDERLGSETGLAEERRLPLTRTIADAVYWLIFLLFLPAVLGALALEGLLEPVQAMLNKIFAFLPNIFTAGLILVVGWFGARIVQRIVTNLLAAIGADRLSERMGLHRLSGLLGLIAYILILVPVLIAALNVLALEAITRPASNMLNILLEALPAIFAAILVVAIAYGVGRLLAGLTTNLLAGAGFDAVLAKLGLRREPPEGRATPSAIVGYLVLVAILLFASIEAARLLGFVALADLVTQFTIFAGHILLGLVIFAIGLFLANVAAKTVLASGMAQAGVLALAARVSIIVLAGAMALRQMGLANEIITLAFGLLLGAVAVAAAIAFGIGGREIAARALRDWVENMRSRES